MRQFGISRMFLVPFLMQQVDPGGGGGGGVPGAPATPPAPTMPAVPPAPAAPAPAAVNLPPEALAGLNNLLARNGNDNGAVATLLYNDNHTLRERVRTLETQLPAQGAVVLAGDDAAQFAALRELGVPLAEIPQRIQALGELQQTQTLRDAADVTGYNFDALKLAAQGLKLEVKTVGEGTEAKRVAYVNEAGKAPVEVTAWMTANRAALLPSLEQRPANPGTQFVAQPVGGSPAKRDFLGEKIKAQNDANAKRGNALTNPTPTMPINRVA